MEEEGALYFPTSFGGKEKDGCGKRDCLGGRDHYSPRHPSRYGTNGGNGSGWMQVWISVVMVSCLYFSKAVLFLQFLFNFLGSFAEVPGIPVLHQQYRVIPMN